MQLHGTPLSHFTRKVRIVLAELGVAYEPVWSSGVLAPAARAYGDNPLMRVPTLVDGADIVIDSDHIARYLVAKLGDPLGVRSDAVADLNRLAVTSGIMANEVTLILAKRGGGIADLDGVTYFRKLATAIESGLAWLDDHTAPEAAPFDYRDVAAICMWQHIAHYQLVPALERYTRLATRVAQFAARPSVARTTPAASLAEATAAGWLPA